MTTNQKAGGSSPSRYTIKILVIIDDYKDFVIFSKGGYHILFYVGAEIAQAPLYIISGFVILGIHALILFLAAKLFKLDLFTCGVASLANVGGVASAPILAAAYSEALIPIGVLMALMGYVIGTGGGLLVGKILSMI
ncbi:DUF819 family protein [Anaerosalibacter bizertensis]|uniref:DUF819 family protein n=1 Tax=Anaerosalibacter bizertensis TaxID=932217 RepID=UPI0021F7085B|nr:DUF819 family protein [Anaerosalibacter bizertensis]